MPQYAVIGSHPPDNCPLTNKAVRDFVKKMLAQVPALEQQLGVKTLSFIHLDPNHKSFALYEAANAEAVRDFLYRAGFAHFLELNFHLVTPIDELMHHVDEMPTVY